MRLKLWAGIIGISATLTWAFFHQISKNEPLPTVINLYAFEADTQSMPVAHTVQEYNVILEKRTPDTTSLEHKIDKMLGAIKTHWGGIFVCSNGHITDQQPAKHEIIKALEHTDIIVERTTDEHLLNAGYIACRANKKTLQLWETIKHMLDEHIDVHPGDQHQDYLASLLHKNKIAKLRWEFAPQLTHESNPVA